jgi:hypothetical protein
MDVFALEGGVEIVEGLMEELWEEKEGGALVPSLVGLATRSTRFGTRMGATYMRTMLYQRAASTSEFILLNDCHLEARLC